MSSESFSDGITESFLTYSEKPAITFLRDGTVESEIFYFELNRDTNRLAGVFLNRGIKKGDRVILFIQKSMFFVVAHLALQKIGAVVVPLNTGFKKSELHYLLEDADAGLVLVEPEKKALIRDIDPDLSTFIIDTRIPYHDLGVFGDESEEFKAVEVKPDDAALLIYTSGTTGKPKGAILTHKNLNHDARNIINIWQIKDSDVICHALPLFHVHGLGFALHTSLLAGAHVLLLDQFSPPRVIEALSKKEGPCACTVFMAVPAMYVNLMDYLGDKKPDFEHMRLWTSGSAPLLAKDFERIHRIFGKEPVEREGMSETGMNFSNPLTGKRKPGSVGLPLPDLEVRIVDPDTGMVVAPGQTGEIQLKGPAISPGYWGKSDETAAAFEHGWFKTGDLGNIDEDGYYYLTDRIKHIIISGGENISPKEVEVTINQLKGVAESSVVGIEDEKWGEKVVAAVIRKPGVDIDEAEIQTYCKQRLHNW